MPVLRKPERSIITLPDDTKNTFVVLTARSLNPSLEIIARASDQKTYNKLSYAGANKVIITSQATGQKLAQMALNPSAVKFLDMFSFGGTPIRVEEIFIPAGCVLAGKTLANLNLPRRIGILVIGITRQGQTIFNPTADTQILAGDTLLVMGKEEGFKKLHKLIESHE
ncbi:TrkA family potassium uptake protein [Thermotoga sp. Ku-13t]|uniref:potassium channel family protein n=1 Tax=Thermotoga sp. Ku-13t TaxID=1755813 RepID=UPI002407971B|nr:TrkA family potassium uptake protein [Thermotoga sp. Ku-13t]